MEPQDRLAPAQFTHLRALDQATVRPALFVLADDVQSIILGRDPICQIVVTQNVVSRQHARIERSEKGYLLHDTGSANGTFVHGLRIKGPYPLRHDDRIGLGSPNSQLQFVDPNATLRPTMRLWYSEYFMLFFFRNQPLTLPPAQFNLLNHLYRNAGTLCSRESCAQALWGRAYNQQIDAAALDQAITNLRGRLREIDPRADVIRTRRGLGYELRIEEEAGL